MKSLLIFAVLFALNTEAMRSECCPSEITNSNTTLSKEEIMIRKDSVKQAEETMGKIKYSINDLDDIGDKFISRINIFTFELKSGNFYSWQYLAKSYACFHMLKEMFNTLSTAFSNTYSEIQMIDIKGKNFTSEIRGLNLKIENINKNVSILKEGWYDLFNTFDMFKASHSELVNVDIKGTFESIMASTNKFIEDIQKVLKEIRKEPRLAGISEQKEMRQKVEEEVKLINNKIGELIRTPKKTPEEIESAGQEINRQKEIIAEAMVKIEQADSKISELTRGSLFCSKLYEFIPHPIELIELRFKIAKMEFENLSSSEDNLNKARTVYQNFYKLYQDVCDLKKRIYFYSDLYSKD